jgi:hypothetical protein
MKTIKKLVAEDEFVVPDRPARLAEATDAAVISPARSLQALIASDLMDAAEPGAKAWAPRTTLLFSGGVSVLLWAAIAYALAAVR